MKLPILKVAVVGHTNTGKTSLLRTLMRDVTFGQVSDRPATTRHVEGVSLMVGSEPAIELYDTPGLEDSIALLDHLDSLRESGGPTLRVGENEPAIGPGARRGASSHQRIDGVDLIRAFLDGPEAHGRFAQEAKALRQVLASDVALYVIDARDRVLGKHRDELEILGRCARPVVPVLNFVASPEAQTATWREHLARVNMHAVAEFDTVVIDEHSERRLLEKMRTLLDRHHATLNALIEERQEQRRQLVRASTLLIADLLIDAAALVVIVPVDEAAKSAVAIESLKQRVREREQRCVEQLLALHRFRAEDYQPGEGADLPLTDGRWGIDLFSPAALKQFGIRTGGAAAAGAMVGLTLDVFSAGLTLGTGTAIGAAIGALLGTGQSQGRRIFDRIRGKSELRCDNTTMQLLLARQLNLLDALLHRGHASMSPIRLPAGDVQSHTDVGPSSQRAVSAAAAAGSRPRIAPPPLPKEIDQARVHPQWSRLSDRPNHAAIAAPARQAAHDRLADAITKLLQSGPSPGGASRV